ncbi:hypothetical protein [Acidovorax sp. Leaf160]|uniref:hypothetical protein n=1 Tax=Acidovorax sp. Leaf160 TaxID=1736280 RepID=UPI0007012845|nr:hypothetical protein [Acidovorax sp. Leaf160]KQR55566.1 hypothetical protein ASF94_03910 [Acidovorax sp. Leaf160]
MLSLHHRLPAPVCALACAVGAIVSSAGALAATPSAAQPVPAPNSAPAAPADGGSGLSSPMGAGGLPAGQGAGYHSPQSPIKPLQPRSDVVPWSSLSNLTKKTLHDRIEPVFTSEQKAMHMTIRRVQGFMVPMDTKPGQKHFLLTSVPLTCAFCIPGGPESMIEVKARTPVRYSLEPVVVEGRFQTLQDDQYGLFYRLVEARQVE